MSEYIDRQKALTAINEFYHDPKVYIVLKEIPPADVRPVVRGEWILKTDDFDFVDGKCSVCSYTDSFFEENWLYNFCPNCGADMRGDKE